MSQRRPRKRSVNRLTPDSTTDEIVRAVEERITALEQTVARMEAEARVRRNYYAEYTNAK